MSLFRSTRLAAQLREKSSSNDLANATRKISGAQNDLLCLPNVACAVKQLVECDHYVELARNRLCLGIQLVVLITSRIRGFEGGFLCLQTLKATCL